MIQEYLKTSFGAVFATLILGAIICYMIVFANHFSDETMPQYLIAKIHQYILVDGSNISLEKGGMEQLQKHNCWLQIIDAQGNVVSSINGNEKLPDYYSYFDIVNYTLNSGQLNHDTLFVNDIAEYPGYSVIIGCDRRLVQKRSMVLSGNNVGIQICLIFGIVMIIVVQTASYIFSQKIAIPATKIMDNIRRVRKGVAIEELDRHSIFYGVSRQLTELQSRLEDNKRMRAEWISNISHDMKTPLSTIRGYSEMLADPGYQFEPAEIRNYAQEISKSEQYIENLISDLRLSQKLVEGRLPLNQEQIVLRHLLQHCIDNVEHLIRNQSVVILDCEENLTLDCDQNLMQRCIINIIGNALVHNQDGVQVEVHAVERSQGITIEIRDDGKGMDTAETKYIFDRYYRGTNSQQQEGTGLGLAIAREIVEAHQGTISVESKQGEGSKFIIQL